MKNNLPIQISASVYCEIEDTISSDSSSTAVAICTEIFKEQLIKCKPTISKETLKQYVSCAQSEFTDLICVFSESTAIACVVDYCNEKLNEI
jgi:hypothetical protein